jgi:hypothetical protein
VPQQITVVPRKWWGGGGKLEAVDARGQRLECKQWDSVVTVLDARSGTTTTLDRQSLDVTVSTEILSKTRPMLSGARTISACKLQQSIKANGDIRVRTNYNAVEERVVYGMAREMPANCEMTVALDEDYEETNIPSNGSAHTAVVHKQRHMDPVETSLLSSRADQSGDLVVTRADGTEEITHLFIAPHALH